MNCLINILLLIITLEIKIIKTNFLDFIFVKDINLHNTIYTVTMIFIN